MQDNTAAEELLQETILLQEVLLTAHMAKAYDFPLMVGRLTAIATAHSTVTAIQCMTLRCVHATKPEECYDFAYMHHSMSLCL